MCGVLLGVVRVLLNPSLQHVYNTDLSVSVIKKNKKNNFYKNMKEHVHRDVENACEQDHDDDMLNKQVP